jgi:hypothetical protein
MFHHIHYKTSFGAQIAGAMLLVQGATAFFPPLPCGFPAGTYMTTGSLRKIRTPHDFALLGHRNVSSV